MVLLVKLKRPGAGSGTSSDTETLDTGGEERNAELASHPLPASISSIDGAGSAKVAGRTDDDAVPQMSTVQQASPHLPTDQHEIANAAAKSESADIESLTNAFSRSDLYEGSSAGTLRPEPQPEAEGVFGHSHTQPQPLGRMPQQGNDNSSTAFHEMEDVSASAARERPSPNVSVYLAPAVLGHRWVRSRSTAGIVERPERLFATLLGIAALIGRLHDGDINSGAAGRSDVKNEDDAAAGLLALASQLESLSVESQEKRLHGASTRQPFDLILSRAVASLVQPDPGLQAIHAHPDELLTPEEIGEAPAYQSKRHSVPLEQTTGKAHDNAWPTSSISYLSLLTILCKSAPSEEPAPPPPRLYRLGQPVRDEPGDVEGDEHFSEIPIHLSQGDLYLCGPSDVRQKGAPIADKSSRDSAPKQEVQDSTFSALQDSHADPLFNVVPSTPPLPSAPSMLPTPALDAPPGDCTKDGSRGAIEASLGTCFAALERVMSAAEGDSKASQSNTLQAIDCDFLDQARHPLDGSSAPRLASPSRRAFVLARPPGHHCTATKPSGFCWVNNVAVLAAQAYDVYGIDRVAILDFDLHHGDGTQSIVWRINAETQVHDTNREARMRAVQAENAPKARRGRKSAGAQSNRSDQLASLDWDAVVGKRGLRISYGSLHDIESFPCEDGDKTKVSEASTCLDGAHGQWIRNVHLDSHPTQEAFRKAYESNYSTLLQHARRFFRETGAEPSKSLVIISAGFDACIYEHQGMQRHGKSVPPEFYAMFTKDAVAIAEQLCNGKCISVLEGGYSDRALTSGVAAHLAGLAGIDQSHGEHICSVSTLSQLEKLAKLASANLRSSHCGRLESLEPVNTPNASRRRPGLTAKDPDWLHHTLEAIKRLHECCGEERVECSITTAPTTPAGLDVRARGFPADQARRSPRDTRMSRSESARTSPAK